MPTINDAIVVSGSGYSTEGNGGRKLVRLDDGTLVVAIKNTTSSSFIFYKSINNGNTWSIIYNTGTLTSIQDVDLVPFGAKVFLIQAYNNTIVTYRSIDVATGASNDVVAIDTSQTALGNVSLAINEAKTELHAAWSSKNSTYPNCFNIRYAKGTINADGTVTWGAVEQVTTDNVTGVDFTNPSIVVSTSNVPLIFHIYKNSNTSSKVLVSRKEASWVLREVYNGGEYAQSSPSAIFVPQSINGLANGRIWVVWHGRTSTSSVDNIKMSYSDDSGVSWSNVIEVTTGSNVQQYPTISYNKRNEVFIVWQGFDATVSNSYVNVRKVKYANSTLSAIETVTNNATSSATYPNSIPSGVDFDSPLFIYTNNQTSSVNFYGSWSVETISPTVGERGKILNRQNILTYNITSESAIGTVTEKINGVVVGTKTLTSGQNTTINITQSQWDSIPYGKYRNNSAGRNTIEIVTSKNTFTYTFEKWFDNTLDVISVTKAVKDSKDYYLPSAKKILSDAINSKGGSTTPTDSIENMAKSVNSSSSTNSKTGVSISSSSTKSFTTSNGGTGNYYYISIDTNILGFIPSSIEVTKTNKTYAFINVWRKENFVQNANVIANYSSSGVAFRIPYNQNVLDLVVDGVSASYDWIAYE